MHEIGGIGVGVVETAIETRSEAVFPLDLETPDPRLGDVLTDEESGALGKGELYEIIQATVIPGE
jgi:hypothetical protein